MRLAITGMGLLTSVGHDALTACASIRAGLQRPREITYFGVMDGEAQEVKPLIARPVHGYTEGFTGVSLWSRLASGAVSDLIASGSVPLADNAAFWTRTGICVVAPELHPGRFDEDEKITADTLMRLWAQPLLESFNWPAVTGLSEISGFGHVGAIAALQQCQTLIASGKFDRFILVSGDSYLDVLTLEWLDQASRIKSDDNPFGLIPGEAGACVMIESATAAQQRGATIIAHVDASAVATSSERPFAGDQTFGVAFADAVEQVLSQQQMQTFTGFAVTDLNGEPWRAHDWGSARVKLVRRIAEDTQWLFPCDSLGETGAAGGIISICLAARAIQRGYAGSQQALVTATSENGMAGSLLLS